MQKIIIKEINTKTGTNDKGEWKLFNVTGSDGAKFSTFDHKAADLQVGDTIEAEIEIKGNNNNLKSFKVLEHGTTPATPASPASSAPANNVMSKEDWREKARIERASIEAQVAFKGIIELFTGNNYWQDGGELQAKVYKVADRALDWAMEKLGGAAVASVPASEPAKSKSDADKDWDNIQSGSQQKQQKPFTLGAVLTWCQSHGKEYTRDWFFKNISLREDQLLNNPANLERVVGDIITKKPDWKWQ